MYDKMPLFWFIIFIKKSVLFIMSINKTIKIQTNSFTTYLIIHASGILDRVAAFDLLRSVIAVKD